MSMGVVLVAISFFGFLANVYCLTVELVHVVKEGEVVVCVWMLGVLPDAVFKVLRRLGVLL